MTITIAGENSFGRQVELKRLSSKFQSDNGELALEHLDGEELDYARLREAVTSLPFLADRKMIVLRSPSKNKQFVENFEQLLEDIPETTEVVIVEPKLDRRLVYYKSLKKKTDFHDFPELDSNSLASWLKDEAAKSDGSLSLNDARYLIDRVGLDQQLLASELEKLLIYGSKITRVSIDLMTEATPQSTIFQMLEAAFSGNTRRALKLYNEQRALKVEPPQIIAMLTWQLHILALIKTASERSIDQIAKEARINPFVIRKSQSIASKLSLGEIKSLISDLVGIDLKSKRTNMDADEALQNYILKLSN